MLPAIILTKSYLPVRTSIPLVWRWFLKTLAAHFHNTLRTFAFFAGCTSSLAETIGRISLQSVALQIVAVNVDINVGGLLGRHCQPMTELHLEGELLREEDVALICVILPESKFLNTVFLGTTSHLQETHSRRLSLSLRQLPELQVYNGVSIRGQSFISGEVCVRGNDLGAVGAGILSGEHAKFLIEFEINPPICCWGEDWIVYKLA